MRREFEITIDPDGHVRIERKGDGDDVCVQEVLPIREVLGELTEQQVRGSFGHSHTHAHGHVHTHEK